MKISRIGVLFGLTLGLFGGAIVNDADSRPVQAQSNRNARDDDPTSIIIDQPTSVTELKQKLDPDNINLKNIYYDGSLTINNQTQLSGHIKEVFGPLFDALAKMKNEEIKKNSSNNNYLNYRYLNFINLSDNNLKSSDLNDLIALFATHKFSPELSTQVRYVDVSDNMISDFSSVSSLPRLTIGDVYGLGQKSDPAVDQKLTKIPIDSNGQAVISMDSIRALVPENYFLSFIAWMSVDANPDDPTADNRYTYLHKENFQPGYFEEPPMMSLDYSAGGWAGIPDNRYAEDNKQRLAELESKRDDPTYIKRLEDRGWTVDLYKKYLEDQFEMPSNLIVKNIPENTDTVYLRLLFANDSGEGVTTALRYSRAASATSSSAASNSSDAGSFNSGTPTPDSSSESSSSTPTVTPKADNDDTLPGTVYPQAKKNQAVNTLQKIYLYRNASFSKSERIATYSKKPRINRPMFIVKGYMYSNTGRLRYKVRDVNHLSKTAGKVGYITSNWHFTRPVYYTAKHAKLTVLNPQGVNEYTKKDLTGKIKNHNQGTVLRVKKIVKHNLTTRYQLTNGHFVTGNRKLVIAGKYQQPKRIKIKRSVNLYQTINLTKRVKHLEKGTVLKVKRWTYSKPYSLTDFGAKRYQVAGGFMTANSKFVKIIK